MSTPHLRPTRPLEHIAFFKVELRTREGIAHVFLAYDAWQDKLFNLGVERDASETTVLKNIYLLLEDPMFAQYSNEGYTLIMEEFQEFAPRIEAVIKPSNGKMLFDKKYHNELIHPVLKHMASHFRKM